jgi:hypothetical protein
MHLSRSAEMIESWRQSSTPLEVTYREGGLDGPFLYIDGLDPPMSALGIPLATEIPKRDHCELHHFSILLVGDNAYLKLFSSR